MTLAVVKNQIANVVADVTDLEARVRFLERALWWSGGACVGFGSLLTLIAPKVIKALGLGA